MAIRFWILVVVSALLLKPHFSFTTTLIFTDQPLTMCLFNCRNAQFKYTHKEIVDSFHHNIRQNGEKFTAFQATLYI